MWSEWSWAGIDTERASKGLKLLYFINFKTYAFHILLSLKYGFILPIVACPRLTGIFYFLPSDKKYNSRVYTPWQLRFKSTKSGMTVALTKVVQAELKSSGCEIKTYLGVQIIRIWWLVAFGNMRLREKLMISPVFILFFIWAVGEVLVWAAGYMLGINNLNKEFNRVCGVEVEKVWDGGDEEYSSGDHPS